MTRSSIISKFPACLLLSVMLYMHLCSALCAIGTGGCCGTEDDDNCKKTCCANEKSADGKRNDCQDMHFAFFNTTGQFASQNPVDLIKVFHSFISVGTPLYKVLPITQNKNDLAYNGFHPPPLNVDIRILVQRFQI